MPRGRKGYDHRDPVTEEMMELEEARKKPVIKDAPESPWWTTPEVAKVMKRSTQALKKIAVEIGLKTTNSFVKGQTCKWTFTDVLMIRRELERQRMAKLPRNHEEKIRELQRMLDANDRGEL